MKRLIIAIDGPSGAGKGTVARELAARLGYKHLDTGAMYRAVAWKAMSTGLPLDDEHALAAVAEHARLDVGPGGVVIDGHDVTHAIRTPEIDRAAAAAARLPKVRAALVRRQRAEGAQGGIVMEGRDIGTVVFPDAQVKIYLDASPEERARRRAADFLHHILVGRGIVAAGRFVAFRVAVFPIRIDVAAGERRARFGVFAALVDHGLPSGLCRGGGAIEIQRRRHGRRDGLFGQAAPFALQGGRLGPAAFRLGGLPALCRSRDGFGRSTTLAATLSLSKGGRLSHRLVGGSLYL